MKRELAIREGVVLPDRRHLTVGSLRVEDAEIPVTWALGGFEHEPLGVARNFEREVQGDEAALFMTFEMYPGFASFNGPLELDDFDLYLYCTNIIETGDGEDNPKVVTDCRIRCVQLVPKYTGYPKRSDS